MEAVFSALGTGSWKSRDLPVPDVALGISAFALGEASCLLHSLLRLPLAEAFGLTGMLLYTWGLF